MMGGFEIHNCAGEWTGAIHRRIAAIGLLTAGVIVYSLSSVVIAEEPSLFRVRLETLDQRTVEGEISYIMGGGGDVEIKTENGLKTIELDAVGAIVLLPGDIQTTLPASDRLSGRSCVFHLADGGMINGTLLSGDLRAVNIGFDGAGNGTVPKIKIRYDGLAAIRFAVVDDGPAEAEMVARLVRREPARDLLIVPMGDKPVVLPGALESLGLDGWEFRLPTRLQKAPLDKAYGVVFGVGPTPPGPKSAMVRLQSGSSFTADIVSANQYEIGLKTAVFGDFSVPWLAVARIDLRSRRVTALSDLSPAAQSGGSALGVEWPMQKDRNVVGGPMRLAGRTIARGLGVHGGTTLVYTLDGGYEKFAATVGIDDAIGRRGSVVFRVLGDGKELFKTDVLRGGMPPVAVNVDVAGVKKLELFADPADGLDIGDHADWGEARLIRQAEAATTKAVK